VNKYPYTKRTHTVAELAYLAGIIDGEGSIYIGNFSSNPKTNVPYYQTKIEVTNTDQGLIDWLCATFGGSKRAYTPKQTPKTSRKPVFNWNTSGDRCRDICELIMPYLIIKKRQAEIMIKIRATFIPTVEKGRQGIAPLSQEVLVIRQQLMEEMRSLHIRVHSYTQRGYLPRVTIDESP
jgi:hypothetical protein